MTASCCCGACTIEVAGAPAINAICHCTNCKRRTGSAFSFNARFPEDRVAIDGRARAFTRVGDDGGRVSYSFCPACGATVHYRIDTQPGVIAIPVGAFADPSFPPPSWSVYHDSRRCAWVELRTEPLTTIG